MNPESIQGLPIETQVEILSYLPREELLNLCEVNRLWNNLCRNELLWKSLYLIDFLPNKYISDENWYKNYKYLYNFCRSYAKMIYSVFLKAIEGFLQGGNFTIDNIPRNLKLEIINNLTNTLIKFIHLYGEELLDTSSIHYRRFGQIKSSLDDNVECNLTLLLNNLNINNSVSTIDAFTPYYERSIWSYNYNFLKNFHK
jgi:hypothetical protein